MAETRAGRSDEEMGWCLRRLGESHDLLLLPEGEEVSLGRGVDVTYQLQSSLSPLMISRTHCFFRQNAAGQWTVTDNKSLNGVFLNKEKLLPQKPYILTTGACIQMGVALPNTEGAEFEYELVQENLERIRPLLTPRMSLKRKSSRTKRKLNCEDSEASGAEGAASTSKAKMQRVLKDSSDTSNSHKNAIAKQPTVKMEAVVELDSSLDADMMLSTQTPSQSTLHLTKIRQSITELRNLNAQVQDKLKTPQQSGCTGSKQSTQQELQDLQKELSTKHEEHLERVDELLKKILQDEQGNNGGSSQVQEERLKEQLAQALKEHSLLMDDLNRSHRDFERIIQAKNKELQETRDEKKKVEAQKEEVLNHMNDVLDNELQCIICSEHFIEAVTLNCAHSFCSFCIQSWRKRKEECPICRQEIKSQTRSLVLDNCIDRMVDKLSTEMKDRRLALILERKDLVAEELPKPILVPSDSEDSSLPSELSVLSSSEDIDYPLEVEEDIASDSEESHSDASEEPDMDDQWDLSGDDDSDDDDYIFFFM